MLKTSSLPIVWALDFSTSQQKSLNTALVNKAHIHFWSKDNLPTLADQEKNNPCLLCLSSTALKNMQTLPVSQKRQLGIISKVVFLDKSYDISDFEEAVDLGIAEIIRPPVTTKRMRTILSHAVETHNIQHDMICMTREIMLERELLQRKNEILSFLVDFLSHVSDSLHLESVLEHSYTALNTFIPINGLHVVLWENDKETNIPASLYIGVPQNTPAHAQWQKELLELAAAATQKNVILENAYTLSFNNQSKEMKSIVPSKMNTLVLPIHIGANHQYGVLVLSTEGNHTLGKDQSLALNSALKHLSLGINNAKQFQRMQQQADFDVLTGIHSRGHFETRLTEEFERYTRYQLPFSAIMLDLDNFKKVNDTHGHLAGDDVLRDIGKILQQSARSTDYCARYGGEEFIVLLSNTDYQQAFLFAERLRKRIATYTFIAQDIDLKITASFGVTSLEGNQEKTKERMLHEVDTALYAAKKRGRNNVKGFGQDERKIA